MNSSIDDGDNAARHRSTVRPEPEPPLRDANDPDLTREFTAFYYAAAPRLMAFLHWQGAHLTDAADCVQDTLAEAFRRWDTLQKPYPWCRRVASRTYARRVATLVERPVDDPDLSLGTLLISPDTNLEAFEARHDLLRLLNRLPSRQRQVMAWTYDCATPTEIAESLRISPEAVRANLYKARAALRDQLRGASGER